MYSVYLGDRIVGSVELVRRGLYYNFSGNFRLPKNSIYRITVSDGEHNVDLGICVPCAGGFELKKTVPVKHFAGKSFSFRAELNSRTQEFIPVSEDKQIECLTNLRNAKFALCDGTAGIVFS